MHLKRMKIIIILSLLLASFSVLAENPPELKIPSSSRDLSQLIEEALANNSELKAFEADVATAKGERTQAGLWRNPEMTLEYGERRVKDPGGPLSGEGTTRSISIRQPFEFPGKGSLRKAIADRNIELGELGLEQFRVALKGRVQQLAYRFAADTQNVGIAREISDYAEAQIDLLRHRAASGIQGMLDLRVIEASLLEVKVNLTELEQSQKDALGELNALLGRPASSPLAVDIKLESPARRFDPEELVRTGLRHNFQLRAREKELQRADSESTAARLDAAPDFAVGPFYSRDKAADDEINLGIALAVKIPLWDWNQGNIEAADGRRSRSEALLEKAKRDVEVQILRRFNGYTLAQKRLKHFEKGYLQKMHDAADLADRHYRLGAVSVQTFMETQKQYLNAGRFYGDAVVSAHENLLDLELLTGGKAEEKP